MRELLRGDALAQSAEDPHAERLRPVLLRADSPAVGKSLAEIGLDGVVVTALVRAGERRLSPSGETRLEPGDAVVLFGSPTDLQRVERSLLG